MKKIISYLGAFTWLFGILYLAYVILMPLFPFIYHINENDFFIGVAMIVIGWVIMKVFDKQ